MSKNVLDRGYSCEMGYHVASSPDHEQPNWLFVCSPLSLLRMAERWGNPWLEPVQQVVLGEVGLVEDDDYIWLLISFTHN